jgi:predicted XRE-type DNA-binding protein
MSEDPEFEYGSGNVFADAGLPNPEEALARSRLLHTIAAIIRERGLTQTQAARLLGTTQPTVSDMMRGKLHLFSLERLITFLKALGQDVKIVVTPRSPEPRSEPALRKAG